MSYNEMFFTFKGGEVIERTKAGMPNLHDESTWDTQMEEFGYEKMDSATSRMNPNPVFSCDVYRSNTAPYQWIVLSRDKYDLFLGGYRTDNSYDLAILLNTFAAV